MSENYEFDEESENSFIANSQRILQNLRQRQEYSQFQTQQPFRPQYPYHFSRSSIPTSSTAATDIIASLPREISEIEVTDNYNEMNSKNLNILDRPLSKGKYEVSLSAYALLFSEIVQYYQSRVNTVTELQDKLAGFGENIGARIIDTVTIRERGFRRDTKLLNVLAFIRSNLWKTLFGREAEKLERANDDTATYYIIEKESLVNKFISVPKDRGNLNCASFTAGILEGILKGCGFPATVTVHWHKGTTFLIKFDSTVISRESSLEVNMKLIEIPFEDPDKCKKRLSSYLRQAFIFTSSYEWMINSYVAEFFVKDFWERFPTSWRICFETLSLDEIAELILSNNAGKTYRFVWPLSLLSYLASCHYLAFDRTQKLFSEKHQTLLKRFPFLMTKHIKPKKRHELSILPNLISKVCSQAGVENVIDVGSGLGHLSRMLSIEHKLDVTAIEMAEERLPLAEQFDKQLAKEIEICSKLEEKQQFGKVRHIAQKIHPSITNKQFYELIGYQENFNSSNCDDKAAVLVGLHTCGDLASTMVRMFKNTNGLKGLVSISCCYMGMTLHDSNVSNDVLIGFPMSNTVSKLNYKSLKYKSFETACHFVDDYITKLTSASPNLKLHCYRAVMEVILRKLNPGMVLTSVRCRKIKNAANMSFVEYAEKVLERVNLKIDWNAMKHIDHELLLLKWKNVVIYHCLVHLMGPVVESIVLADKWIFLLEQGFKANLLPVFNPSVSPRNFALIAIK